jgi:multimeric flavodoxin WrbA
MIDQGKKKVIVLTCGRPMGNCEILGREACIGAEEAGATTEILRLQDFKIKPCTGCEGCTMSLSKGGKAGCVIRDDDAEFLLQKVLYEDCALIISAPVFFLTTPGYLKVLQDRMIPFVLNRPELFFDPKTRVGASISVGGAEPAWTPMGISMTNMFLLYTRIIVEQQLVNFASRPGVVTLNERALKRARDLGRNIAIAAGTPIDQVRFMGEELENSCPVCHVNIVQIGSPLPRGTAAESGYFDLDGIDEVVRKSPADASHVVCPTCDVWGKLEIEDGRIKVVWDDESARHHRLDGMEYRKHYELIKRIHLEAYRQEDKVKGNKIKYRTSEEAEHVDHRKNKNNS